MMLPNSTELCYQEQHSKPWSCQQTHFQIIYLLLLIRGEDIASSGPNLEKTFSYAMKGTRAQNFLFLALLVWVGH